MVLKKEFWTRSGLGGLGTPYTRRDICQPTIVFASIHSEKESRSGASCCYHGILPAGPFCS